MTTHLRAGPLRPPIVGLFWLMCIALGCSTATRPSLEAAIVSPREGDQFEKGANILFKGEALEGAALLPETNLLWSSDQDGTIGSGRQMERSDLSLGSHLITLTAQGILGGSASDSIRIEIILPQENHPPVAQIMSPSEGAQFRENQPVIFTGQAHDIEDGNLPGWALTWISSQDGILGNGLQLTIPSLSPGSHLITLNAIDGAGLSGKASVGILVLHVGENLAPVITILSPQDGAALTTGRPVLLSGRADDPEDGALAGEALLWSSSKDGALGSGATLQVTLSQGVHLLTLSASDSQGKSSQAAVSVAVNPEGNQPPQVSIQSPVDSASFLQASAVPFRGGALDPEDGALIGAALVWSSDVDGPFGNGESVDYDSLSVGLHRVTLVATDSGNAQGVASVRVRISPQIQDQPPVPQIDSPADGSIFDQGQTIEFVGGAIDPEDGVLHGASLSWSSDRDGPLGNGDSFSIASLSAGQHRISLTAIDSQAVTGQVSIGITIRPGQPQNLPPTARLIGPNQAMARSTVVFDGSGSSDSDGSVVRYVFDFGDGNPIQDGSSPTATHVYATEGDWVATLLVYDDDGASASADLSIHVTPFVRSPVLVEDSRDQLGMICALDFGADGLAHIAFRNSTHPSVRLAHEQTDGSFVVETVEGFGLEIGGDAGQSVDVSIDSSGNTHMAYLVTDTAGDTVVRYARGDGAGWSLVSVAPAAPASFDRTVALGLNPSYGQRPELMFRKPDGDIAALARCDANCHQAANWTIEDVYQQGTGTSNRNVWPADFKIAPDGSAALVFSVAYYDSNYNSLGGLLYRRRDAGGFWQPVEEVKPIAYISGLQPRPARLAFDAASNPLVLLDLGVAHNISGAWKLSSVEQSALEIFDITFDQGADTAFLLNRHDNDIELIRENQGSYWVYRNLGPLDQAWPEITLDPNREVRACFARDGNMMLY